MLSSWDGLPTGPKMAQLTDVYGQAIEAAATGNKSVKAALAKAQSDGTRDPQGLSTAKRKASEGEDVGRDGGDGLGRADARAGGVPAGRRPLPQAAQLPGVLLRPAVLRPLSRLPRRPGSSGRSGSSFNQGGLLDSAKFVGFRNWHEIGADSELTTSIKNTAIYVVEAIFLVFTLALLLALLLNRYRRGSNFFKLALYVPLLAPAVLVGLIWQFVTNYDFGLINVVLDHARPRAR